MSDAAEWELKAVVPDWDGVRARLEATGVAPVFDGLLADVRYDTGARDLTARDHALRTRAYRDAGGALLRASVDWKGPTETRSGYKVREERSTPVGDPEAMAVILERLGYEPMYAIERHIVQYEVAGAVVRLERYPRMDDLVEVEGTRESIEAAIRLTGLSREAFTSDALPAFVERFEARTGMRAALSAAERGVPSGPGA